jgi:hypothetical protein
LASASRVCTFTFVIVNLASMFRAPDVWDLVKPEAPKLTCGFTDGLLAKYKRTGKRLVSAAR